MSTWPGTLPQDLELQNFNEVLPDNLIRSEMDVGPAKVRRRTRANVGLKAGQITCTAAQWTTLETFYNDTVAGGSLTFTWGSDTLRFTGPPTRRAESPTLFLSTFRQRY